MLTISFAEIPGNADDNVPASPLSGTCPDRHHEL